MAEPAIHIIYGTQTGTAENIAYALAEKSRARSLFTQLDDMQDIQLADIQQSQCLIIITSTYGDGDMPDNALLLWQALGESQSLDLSSTAFAVLGLGDSSFPNFCAAGRNWDRRLEELGAQRMLERVDCDNDYEEPSEAWQSKVIDILQRDFSFTFQAASNNEAVTSTQAELERKSRRYKYDQSHPMKATLTEKYPLTTKESSKRVMHYTLSIPEDERIYSPGDILNVFPRNEVALVNAILTCLEFDCEQLVNYKNEEQRLGKLLSEVLDIRNPSTKFLEHIASETANTALQDLLNDPDRLKEYLWCKDILFFLHQHPDFRPAPQTFVELMRALTPRSYSIASSPATFGNEVHLTVSTVTYQNGSRSMQGTSSGYLANKLQPGDSIACYLQANRYFTLPEDDSAPIIMIGPGTGIAPFRCFLQERESRGAVGKNWLFFGDRHSQSDFLYKQELESLLQNGLLTRLDCAFSRDQAEKTYVQHRMLDQAKQFFEWLEDGAYVFVCGDANQMAKDVEHSILNIIETCGNLRKEAALEYLVRMRQDHRYERDVY